MPVESVARLVAQATSTTDEEPFDTETAEILEARRQHRLWIVEALIWGVEHPEELVALVGRARNREEAVSLLADFHGFDEFLALHLLDLTFFRLLPDAVARLREERERLRRGDDTATR